MSIASWKYAKQVCQKYFSERLLSQKKPNYLGIPFPEIRGLHVVFGLFRIFLDPVPSIIVVNLLYGQPWCVVKCYLIMFELHANTDWLVCEKGRTSLPISVLLHGHILLAEWSSLRMHTVCMQYWVPKLTNSLMLC